MKKKKRKTQQFLQRKFPKKMQKKLVMLFMAMILAFVVLIGRITYINASHGDKYSKVVLDQQHYDSRIIPFKRGDILDANGTKLASSERVYNLILDARLLSDSKKKIPKTKQALIDTFGIEGSEIDKALDENPKGRYNILKKKVDYNSAQAFIKLIEDKDSGIAGVWLEEDYVRTYPYGALASDAIGFVVDGNIGNAGVEASYNDVLNGTDGREYGYFNADSTVERTVKEPTNGNSVVTTIDLNLQNILEKHLNAFNEEYQNKDHEGPGALNASVILMDPDSGAILGMSSRPNYDLNNPRDLSTVYYNEETVNGMNNEDYVAALNQMWNNFSVSATYEPGSTIKPFSVASALESGAITGDETFYCGGSLRIGGYDIGCVNKQAHGTLTVSQILEKSCNVGIMQIAQKMGVEEFSKYQKVFGFGENSGIDLPGDSDTSALMYHADNMGATDLATNSFGQNFNVTMMQLAAGYASLINGGNYYQPHVVSKVQGEAGNIVSSTDPVLVRKTISEETSIKLKSYMRETVINGTARPAAVEGYDVGGKTGTAEKLPRNDGRYLNSFIGYAPQEHPEVLIYTIIDEPNLEEQSASALACKLSSKIMSDVLPYLNVPKSE